MTSLRLVAIRQQPINRFSNFIFHNQYCLLIMQGKGKKKYVRKQDTQSQIYQKNTVKYQRNSSQLDPQSKTPSKNLSFTDFDEQVFDSGKSYKFSYKFNEYVRLSLVKILPPKSKKLVIKKQEQTLLGPQNECETFIKGIKTELENFVMKMIKVQQQLDIDQIQFHLNPDYQVKVYRIKYVELAANDVSRLYGFKDQAQNLIRKMKNQNQILIRIKKESSQDCINDINEIVKKERAIKRPQQYVQQSNLSKVQFASSRSSISELNNTGLTHTTYKSQSSEGSIHEDQNEPSFYQMENLKAKNTSGKVQKQKELLGKKKNQSCVNLIPTLSEPYQDDSVSVVDRKKKQGSREKRNMKKKEEYKQEYNSRPKIQPKQKKQLRRYEFEGDDFDEEDFQAWLKEKRNLQKEEVTIEKQTDPYDKDICRYIVCLKVDEDLSMQEQSQKEEAIEVYFKYKKVIFFKLINQTYKKQLIDEQQYSDEALKVQYIKGYKSPKWNQSTMWRHIVKKDYTAQKRSANTEYFQAFYLEGLMKLVRDKQFQIKKKIEKQPKNDIQQQIMFMMAELADEIRGNQKLKNLLKKHAQYIVSSYFKHYCSIQQISFVLSGIKIILLVKVDQHANFIKTAKSDLVAKLKSQLKFNLYQSNIIIDRFTYQKLEKKIIILQKKQKSFIFLASNLSVGNTYNQISSIFNSMNVISQKEIVIQDFLLGKKIEEKVQQLKKKNQFSELKSNLMINNKKNHIFKFYGREILLDQVEQILNHYKQELIDSRLSYHEMVKLKEKNIAQDQEIIDRIHKKYKVFLLPTEGVIQCRINLVSQAPSFKKKCIFIKNSKSLDYAPLYSSILFRNLNQTQSFDSSWVKTFKNWVKKQPNTPFKQKNRNYIIMVKNNLTSSEMLKSTLDSNHAISNIVMIMSQYDKKIFVLEMVRTLLEQKKYQDRQINLYLIQPETTVNFELLFGFQAYSKDSKKNTKVQQKVVKYYVSDGSNLFYYSKSGNQKILECLKKNKTSVILNNEDLNISHTSHKYVRQTSSILHLQSNKMLPVQVYGNKVTFILNHQTFEMPSTEAFKVLQCANLGMPQADLSLGVYEIKLDSMQQVNLFSGYTRKLSKQENIVKVDKVLQQMQVQYNLKVGEIIFQYSSEENVSDNLSKSVKQVNQFILGKIKTKEFSLKELTNLTNQDIQAIKAEIEEDESIKCTYRPADKSLSVQLFDDNQFLKIQWKIKLLQNTNLSKRMKEQVKYPDFWQPQRDPIQEFIVPQSNQEFKRVQNLFKIGKIKCLIRIQNQIIYKKYYDEGQFLKTLNDGTPIRKMELFHGTRNTNPEDIYKDKQESFNINYSSDSNLLGRGIYFAQKSEYSNSYRYTQVIDNMSKVMGIFGANKVNSYSMFLCEVYVGQSQKCKQHNGGIKDTSFRDLNKKIRYQSMTDFLQDSNIFVVYKSRRAYPLYLIKY